MKIDFISDGSRQKNPPAAPATEKDSRLENPLKSGKMWFFQRCKNEKSDGSDGFWVGWEKLTLLPMSERRKAFVGDQRSVIQILICNFYKNS